MCLNGEDRVTFSKRKCCHGVIREPQPSPPARVEASMFMGLSGEVTNIFLKTSAGFTKCCSNRPAFQGIRFKRRGGGGGESETCCEEIELSARMLCLYTPTQVCPMQLVIELHLMEAFSNNGASWKAWANFHLSKICLCVANGLQCWCWQFAKTLSNSIAFLKFINTCSLWHSFPT